MAEEMVRFLGDLKQGQILDYLAEIQKPVTLKDLQNHLLEVSISKTPTRYGEIVRLVSNLESRGCVESDYLKNAPDEDGTSVAEITKYGLKVHDLLVGVSGIVKK